MFGKIFSNLVDFLFPKEVEALELEALSPADLLEKLTPAKELDQNTQAIWNYADERVRTLIWEIKYRRNERVISSVSQVLFDVLVSELAERALFDNFKQPLLIPIPTSDKRRRERGYNQTELLCEALKKLDTGNILEYSPSILKKVVHTESQTLTENKKERIRNMENTMKAVEGVRGRPACAGRNVVLIDDVTTTGATIGDARRALRESGAKKILCLTIAH